MPERAFRSRRVVTPEGERPACVRAADGTIASVDAWDAAPAGVLDFGDAVLMPGVVDAHVHVNEPGRTEWEGFETATRAAAAGGVTTICDMPLNSVPVTTTPAAVASKAAALAGRVTVDVALWGGLVPANARALGPLLAEGLPGCKCFLVPSGIDEFPNVSRADLETAMPDVARLGSVLLAHAELPGPIEEAEAEARPPGAIPGPTRPGSSRGPGARRTRRSLSFSASRNGTAAASTSSTSRRRTRCRSCGPPARAASP